MPDAVRLVQVLGMNHAELPADKNKKTKCAVYLRDLQEQARPPLSLAALHHITAIAGPRYRAYREPLRIAAAPFPLQGP